MWEILVLVFTQVTSPIEVFHHENAAEQYVCITPRGIMDVYPTRPFYSTLGNIGKLDAILDKHQEVKEVPNAPYQIFYISDELHHFNPVVEHLKATTPWSLGATNPLYTVWGQWPRISPSSKKTRKL